MSARLFSDDITFLQRLLRAEGLYNAEIDGVWGPETESAVQLFDSESQQIMSVTRGFDSRSERSITTLALRAQRSARLSLGRILDGGLRARIISGTRTYEQQDVLYRQGRESPGPIVTHARAGYSNHNFGIAWDIGLFANDGSYIDTGSMYDRAADLGLSADLEWGGSWKSFVDKPHYQLHIPMEIDELRVAFESGQGSFLA